MHTLIGSLTHDPVPELIRRVVVSRGSGTLSLLGHEEERLIEFVDGRICGGRSSRKRFGDHLRERGLLDEENLERALRLVDKGMPIGKALIATGAVPADVIERELQELVTALVTTAFAWRRGVYRFRPAEGNEHPDRRLDLSTPALVVEALRQVPPQDWMLSAVGSETRRLVFGPRAAMLLERLNLSGPEAVAVALIDQGAALRDLVARRLMDEGELVRFLYSLMVIGVLNPSSAAAPRPRATMEDIITPWLGHRAACDHP